MGGTKMENYTISVIVANDQLVSKGVNSSSVLTKPIPVDTLKENLHEFVSNIGKSFDGLKSNIKEFELEEFEVSAEISASGGINLIGTVQGGAKSAIKLKFKRTPHE